MNIPPCKCPDHPADASRTKGMVIVQESNREVVFACTICRDAVKVISAQVISLHRGWNTERELLGIPRAKTVRRTPVGKIKYFR